MRAGKSSPPSVKWKTLTDGVARADAPVVIPDRLCALSPAFRVRRTGTRAISNINLLTPRNLAMTLSFSIEIGCEAKPASIDRKDKRRAKTERVSPGDVFDKLKWSPEL